MISYMTNLNPNMHTNVRQWNFPGGEVGVDINVGSEDTNYNATRVWVDARIRSSDDVMALVMATDALKRHFPLASFGLDIPYFPYARQDRVCNAGEALSVKVMGSIINGLGYATVQLLDPHSSVAEAVIDNVYSRSQYDVFHDVKSNWSDITIVAPDMGASKKVEEFARRVGAQGVVAFNKTRELSTGKITGMHCLDPLSATGKYLVLDDICDGGRTFIELIKHFPLTATVDLAVTHGIFSKGYEIVTKEFSKVYTTDSFQDFSGELPENLVVIKV